MNEHIDIVDSEGVLTGNTELKSIIHKKGYYHNTAHVWLFTNDGKILLAQRSAAKVIYPLLWDVSAAGHVDAGEKIKQAAIRETHEEIGLSLHEHLLEKIGIFPCFKIYKNGIIDNEFHHTFIAELTVEIGLLTPQENEVETFKLVSFEEFENLLAFSESNNHFIKSNSDYYSFVLNRIKQKIKQQ